MIKIEILKKKNEDGDFDTFQGEYFTGTVEIPGATIYHSGQTVGELLGKISNTLCFYEFKGELKIDEET